MIRKLSKGEYYGEHEQVHSLGPLNLSDTTYTHEKVDWHYHEQAYFTFLLKGKLFEANKKESYVLDAGSLVFHNSQDSHYNLKDASHTRGFHVELSAKWFHTYELSACSSEGSKQLHDPRIRQLFYRMYLESKIQDTYSSLSIDQHLVEVFGRMQLKEENKGKAKEWLKKLEEIIEDEESLPGDLSTLARSLNVHPVHLSRTFSKYYQMSLGEYFRIKKLNQASQLLFSSSSSLTEIAYSCGFYDQSHFISQFKRYYSLTPSAYRKKMREC
ncbi:MAG: AraC family transcriptional regulator [Bacteroidia bacterium]|nr:AraC family transcriptional regulator [Bacteroidia bacterium]